MGFEISGSKESMFRALSGRSAENRPAGESPKWVHFGVPNP